MKSFKFFSTMLILLMMSVSMVSCGSDDDDEPDPVNPDPEETVSPIVGTWKWTSGTLSLTMKFNDGDTGSVSMKDTEDNYTVTEDFEYTYDEEEDELIILGSSFEGYYNVIVTSNTLRLEFYDDGWYYYELKRV